MLNITNGHGREGKKKGRYTGFDLDNGAGGRTRTYEARKREIYSLLSLPLDDSSNVPIITNFSKKGTTEFFDEEF